MDFAGIQKLTLLDYPGKTACTLFTTGCNLRCSYCHNASLVIPERFSAERITEDEVLGFLKKRQGLLDGVCITGGEPLLHINGLIPFIEKLRKLGFSVKLDTNGTHPEELSKIILTGLLDYIAMDIKNDAEHYAKTVGLPDFDISGVLESVSILSRGNVEHEFRTTVVRELHTVQSIREAARMIAGAKRYYLQVFRDSGDLIAPGFTSPDRETLLEMQSAAMEFCRNVELRGDI